jgi:hypothetical protein
MLALDVALTAAVNPVATTVANESTVKTMVLVPEVKGTMVPAVTTGVKPFVHLYGTVMGAVLTPATALGSIEPKLIAAAVPENLQMLWIVAVTTKGCVSAAEAKPLAEMRAIAMIEFQAFRRNVMSISN